VSEFEVSPAERIEFMISTDGFAIEAVAPEHDPPRGGDTYTIGFQDHAGFADVVVFGLTPVAARGLIGLVAEMLVDGTQIPIGVELVGLLDNELRCCFAPVDVAAHPDLFALAVDWHGSPDFAMVQLLYPDRNGFLPYEAGFDQRARFAQPVVGRVDLSG